MIPKETQNQKDLGKIAISPIKLERSQIYIGVELRKLLKWKTEEDLIAVGSSNILLLFKAESFEKIKEALEDAVRRLEEIKQKI